MRLAIHFFTLASNFKFKNTGAIKSWINRILNDHKKFAGKINIILVNDDYMLDLNRNYLNKDYYTDVITFNFNENNLISGDIYISIDRIKENAANFATSTSNELLRVIIHGILHLIGYKDNTESEKKRMQAAENKALLKAENLIVI